MHFAFGIGTVENQILNEFLIHIEIGQRAIADETKLAVIARIAHQDTTTRTGFAQFCPARSSELPSHTAPLPARPDRNRTQAEPNIIGATDSNL